MARRGRVESVALVLLRTLIGWHFFYEGYYKLATPGWSRDGSPLQAWSAAGYLKAATGPLADVFHAMAQSSMAGWVDVLVPLGLLLVGVSLLVGLFTQAGLWGALAFLTLFYVSAIPTEGVPRPWNEGTYLFVNKNLIEWAAVAVLLACRTGEIAGLDLWRRPFTGVRHEPFLPEVPHGVHGSSSAGVPSGGSSVSSREFVTNRSST